MGDNGSYPLMPDNFPNPRAKKGPEDQKDPGTGAQSSSILADFSPVVPGFPFPGRPMTSALVLLQELHTQVVSYWSHYIFPLNLVLFLSR